MTAMRTGALRLIRTAAWWIGDSIMYICGKYMKEQGSLFNNTVVTTIMSNFRII